MEINKYNQEKDILMSKFISILLSLYLGITMTACTTNNNTFEPVKQLYEITKPYLQTTYVPVTERASPPTSQEAQMRVHFIDVGQADSTFIELANGQTMLIDAGRRTDSHTITDYINNLQYNRIDFVVATHPHDDHIGGMANILDNFDIGKMYMPKQPHTISAFENMLDVIEKKDIPLYTAKSGTNITSFDNTRIDILAPFADNNSNLNNCSAVVKLTYGTTIMLFTGDAEYEVEQQLLNSDIDSDLLKVGHHGSSSSSSSSFISTVSPEIAVISVGTGNSYGHPDTGTIATLNQAGAKIYRTDEQGTIIVTADSNSKLTVDKKATSIKENAPPPIEKYEPTESFSNQTADSIQVVYRTKTGKKYHLSGCTYLKSQIETTVTEAQSIGLEPCSRCNPPR